MKLKTLLNLAAFRVNALALSFLVYETHTHTLTRLASSYDDLPTPVSYLPSGA